MNSVDYKKKEADEKIIDNEYDALYRVILTLSRKCNYRCPFCPHSTENIPNELRTGFMTVETALKLKELLKDKFKGVFSLSGFGEPTLNPDFLNIIDILKTVPGTSVDVITNGTNTEVLKKCHADTIHISAYSKELYDKFIEEFKDDSRVEVLSQYNNTHFNNRAGNVKEEKNIPDTCCNILFMKISVDYNGDIIKCCSDWDKSDLLGNIYKDDIWNIWINQRKEDRIKALRGKRKNIKVCNRCTAEGNLYGNNYKDFWEKYYAEH